MLKVGDEVMFYTFVTEDITIGRGTIVGIQKYLIDINWYGNRSINIEIEHVFPYNNKKYIDMCDTHNYKIKLEKLHAEEMLRLKTICDNEIVYDTRYPYIIFVKVNESNIDELFRHIPGYLVEYLDHDNSRINLLKYFDSINVFFPITKDSTDLFDKFVKSDCYTTLEELNELDPMSTMIIRNCVPVHNNELDIIPVNEY